MLKWGSRKFVIVMALGVVNIALPIIYKKLEITDDILMTVLISGAGVVSAYTGFNVLEKKWTK